MEQDAKISIGDVIEQWIDRHIPSNLTADPESARRARLIMRFGVMGVIFGLIYASFYVRIGHVWGATIIFCCTAGMAITPPIMLIRRSTKLAGHFFSLTLTLGFFSLCCVEGGMRGHALAWLVSVPLCALLLLGARAAALWVGIAFLSAGLIVGCDFAQIPLSPTYDPKWESIVSGAGYLGLVLFMSLLGLIFERGRAQAHARMQAALKKLSESNDQLTKLNQEKIEFMGIAAHDLKNPLTAIMGFGEMIRLIDDPEAIQEMAGKIIATSDRMHHLIKDLLDTNEIEEGRFASKIESCRMNPLVEQIVEQNRFAAEKKQIAIRLGLSDELIVRTDSAAALQILDNLISNAVKYSPPNSTIHVHLMPEKDNAVVLVRDEGPGISEEDQTKLFQKYSRLTARPTGGESSNGLGLSIAKRLAQALGGDIRCRSALGAGTTFSFRLPLGSRPALPSKSVPDVDEILGEEALLCSSLLGTTTRPGKADPLMFTGRGPISLG